MEQQAAVPETSPSHIRLEQREVGLMRRRNQSHKRPPSSTPLHVPSYGHVNWALPVGPHAPQGPMTLHKRGKRKAVVSHGRASCRLGIQCRPTGCLRNIIVQFFRPVRSFQFYCSSRARQLGCARNLAATRSARADEFGAYLLVIQSIGPDGVVAGCSRCTLSHTSVANRNSSRGLVLLTGAPIHRCRQSWRRRSVEGSDGNELNFSVRIILRVRGRGTHRNGLESDGVGGGWDRAAARSDMGHRRTTR